MRELSKVVLFSAIGTIVSLFIIIVFLIKKKEHKDFKAVVFAFSIFTLICLYLSITGLVDILNVKNGQAHSKCGICDIVKFEDVGGRFGDDSFLLIIVNDITIEADGEEFPNLKEGTYECTIQYSKNSNTLIDIQLNK